eukprot:206383_1
MLQKEKKTFFHNSNLLLIMSQKQINSKKKEKSKRKRITSYADIHHEIDKNNNKTDFMILLNDIKDKDLTGYGNSIHTLLYHAATKPNIKALIYLIKECKNRFSNDKISAVLNKGTKTKKEIDITPLTKTLLTLRKNQLEERLKHRHIALLFIGNGTDENCESVMEPHKDERKSADDYQIVKPIEVAFSLYDPELFLAIMFRNTDKIMDINGNPLIDIQYKIYKLWFNEYNKSKLNVIKLHGNDCSVDIFAEALRYLYYTPKTPILYERCWNLKSTIANIIETTFNNIQMIFDNELSPKAIREERDMITRMFSDAQSKNLKAAKIKRIKANSIPFISFYADQKIIVNWNSMNSCRKTGVSTNIFLDNMMSIFPALKVIDIVNISTNHLGVILRSILLFANHNSEKCLRRIRIHNGDISDNLVVRYTRKFADETNWILENDIILTLRKPNYVMNGDINQHLCRVLLAPTAGIYMPVIQEWKDIKLDMRIFPNGVTDVYNKYIGLRIIGWKFAKHIQKIQFHCKISLKEYDECASGTFTLSEGDECRFDTFVLKNNVRFLNQLTFKAEITVTELYNVN